MTIKEHVDHEWERISPCVYCKPCGTRLYQGTIPKDKQSMLALDELIGAVKRQFGDESQEKE